MKKNRTHSDRNISPAAVTEYNLPPAMETVRGASFNMGGEIGRRLAAVTEQWVLPAPAANPGMLAMFRERDRLPLRNMVPWAGEFAGKYLTHASQIFSLTRDPRLKAHLQAFVGEFISCIDDDGYIGPWPKDYRLGLNGNPPNCGRTWDAWGHYHAILGFLKWNDVSGGGSALSAACRIADYLCARLLGTGRRIHEAGEHEMNMAPYHALLLLYHKTGERRYLQLAEEIEKDFENPPAGDYVRTALQGMEFHETPKPRWESLHAIQGIAEKYFIAGDVKYRRAFEHLWRSMLKGDRHNNGGFSSGEKATGSPYALGAIETCCTVAWTAMTVDMLRMTGDSKVADELEFTLFNSGLGLMNPSGRWVTYDTPMEGRRLASAHSINFQLRAGAPELNCCSVNGPRMLGMISDWAMTRSPEAIHLNYYGPSSLSFELPSGRLCKITQKTDYPRDPKVEINVGLKKPESFRLALRIPHWSEKTSVRFNGRKIDNVSAGKYLVVDRTWKSGDMISVRFDFRPHFWVNQSVKTYQYSNWEAEWKAFGPVHMPSRKDQSALLAKFADPDGGLELAGRIFKPVKVKSNGGLLDIWKIPMKREGNEDTMFLFTEIESKSDDALPIFFSAAWTSVITVNGKKIYDGESCNFDGDISLRIFRAELPLRRGRNIVGWAITRHPNHGNWGFTAGYSKPLSEMNGAAFHPTSIYRGPILLAFDHRFNSMDVEKMPGFDAKKLGEKLTSGKVKESPQPWILLECNALGQQKVRLCDFASAGVTGNPYRSWFNVENVKPAEFSPDNPLRSSRQTLS